MTEVSATGFSSSWERAIVAAVKRVFRREEPRRSWQVSVAALTAAEMRRIHIRYRRQRYVPDVLSFLLTTPTRAAAGSGEILVCPAQLKRDARALGVPWRTHAHRMVIHSCLHLLGYHHDNPRAQARMEMKERGYSTHG